MKRYRCNVVVAGSGAAGLSSALSALEKDASVIMLERSTAEERGGNTRWSEALLRLGKNGELYEGTLGAFANNAGYHVPPEFVSPL